MMMMIVLRLLSFVGLNKGCFQDGGRSVDSWTPGPKPLCHRRPTGPHPSGLLWTPAKGDSTKTSVALAHPLHGRSLPARVEQRFEPTSGAWELLPWQRRYKRAFLARVRPALRALLL